MEVHEDGEKSRWRGEAIGCVRTIEGAMLKVNYVRKAINELKLCKGDTSPREVTRIGRLGVVGP